MSISDDAREIARYGPGGHGTLSDSPCVYCCFIPHQEECVWLSMSKIVAALEAAEMVSIAYEEARILYGDGGSQMSHAMQVLDDALDGEAP